MALDLISPLIDLIGSITFAIRNRNSGKHVTSFSTPVACLTFLFFGFIIGGFSFTFYHSFSFLGTFIFIAVVALLIGISIWRGIISLGFKFSTWLAFVYAGFFTVGFLGVVYLGSTH